MRWTGCRLGDEVLGARDVLEPKPVWRRSRPGDQRALRLDRERILRGLLRSLEERGSVRAAELLLVEVQRERREVDDAWAELSTRSRRPPRLT